MNPDEALQRIFISRSFTCYQMEQAITRLLPSFLPRIGSTTAIILGMLDTLYDEQAPLREVRNILHRVLEALREMERNGVSLLICVREQNALPHERSRLLDTLKSGVDTIYRVEASSESLGLILHDGTHSTDIHQHHRQRSCQLG
jgi:hypothetical protein